MSSAIVPNCTNIDNESSPAHCHLSTTTAG